MRERRVANGALRLDQPKITFSMDRDTMLPQGFQLYEHRHSNKLIEEFMLLANSAVAKKIADSYPEQAMLRRHPEPKRDVMEGTLEMLSHCGEDNQRFIMNVHIRYLKYPSFRSSYNIESGHLQVVGTNFEMP